MDREQATNTLRSVESELKAIGVLGASLFGSVARGESGPNSDIDVAVRLAENFSSGGLDYFWQLEQLQKRLSHLYGCQVDVVVEPVRKQAFQSEIDKDRTLVF